MLVTKQQVVDSLKKYWPLLLVLLIGIGLGYGIAPTKVKTVTTTQTITQTVEKKVVDEDAVQAEVDRRVQAIQADMQKHVVQVIITKKDGTKVEKTTTDTVASTKTTTETDKTAVAETDKTVTDNKDTESKTMTKTVTTPILPQWKVDVLVGLAPRFNDFASSPLMVQVQASRRLAGPLFVTAAVQAGSPVTGFTVTNAAVMVGLGAEF